MQITGLFDDGPVKCSFAIKREDIMRGITDEEYIRIYLNSLFNQIHDIQRYRGYTVYDLCIQLSLVPKPFYAHLGWGCKDPLDVGAEICHDEIKISFVCKLL